jgi:hypothetical protein
VVGDKYARVLEYSVNIVPGTTEVELDRLNVSVVI